MFQISVLTTDAENIQTLYNKILVPYNSHVYPWKWVDTGQRDCPNGLPRPRYIIGKGRNMGVSYHVSVSKNLLAPSQSKCRSRLTISHPEKIPLFIPVQISTNAVGDNTPHGRLHYRVYEFVILALSTRKTPSYELVLLTSGSSPK